MLFVTAKQPYIFPAPGNEAFLWKAIKPRLDDKLLAPEGGESGAPNSGGGDNEDVEMSVVKNEMTDD